MGESEWVRLTEEGVDGSSSHYSYRKGSVLWKHGLAWTSTRKQCGPLRRPDQFLTDAELDALAAHAPAVKALVEAARAARSVLEHEVPYDCWATGPNTGDPIVDLVACHACAAIAQIDTALAALDPATPEEDDARQ